MARPRLLGSSASATLRIATLEQRASEADSRLEALEAALARKSAQHGPAAQPTKATSSIAEWCDGFISRSTYYDLPPSRAPKKVKVGARTLIRESREDWLTRIAEQREGADGAAMHD
jgi:hypothetical protein